MLHLDGCKLAILVNNDDHSGGFTTDDGSWALIATRGRAVLDDCM